MWVPEQIRGRLRELSDNDPGLRRFGARRHRYLIGPTVAENDLARFELAHAIVLPESYRSFLATVGDGGAGPYYGLFRHDGSDWPQRVERFEQARFGMLDSVFPHTAKFRPSPTAEPCPAHARRDEGFDPCWLAGSLLLGEFGCGAFFRLVVTGPARGQVWFDDLANDQGLAPGPDFRDWYVTWLGIM